ncbi:MAG: polyphosphate kinase 2 family protein [Rickettsiales bacterium]|nr:polyphosphate kinase 2 family protein [Rickettsiales bacterium]
MIIDSKRYRAPQGQRIKLDDWDTLNTPFYTDKKDYKAQIKASVGALSELQEMLYAHDKHSLLVVFQAMDAAGKDGTIRHVFSGMNPQGFQVSSFKKPSDEELDHDFLWRTTKQLPERGRIGIFNRSYYEEVLIVKVHQGILKGQKLPSELISNNIWQERYRSITDFESHLERNGTKVVKFFLHLSKEEQRQRFLARIDEPEKNWKFSEGDVKERGYWDEYQTTYAEAISATSTEAAPWYIVPADDKKNARLIVSQVLRDTLSGFHMNYPAQALEQEEKLQEIRKQLLSE